MTAFETMEFEDESPLRTPNSEYNEHLTFKVATSSRPHLVAGAVAGVIRQGNSALLQAVGAGAVNQAVKAVIIARGYLNDDGIALVCTPSFLDIQIGDEQRTAICLNVEARPSHM